ncbi:flagellar hook-length control protein [Mycolicibacterium tokaiense]|uniref:Flagellar hook-length control protein n=1 Tax=Mycolicibacterium tokaiense TaxID=39695 RepID=A0A378TJ20_9MYCO|nr:flagellar hook-length control protein [Mycolicibacterium tokaiense]BBY84693.1 hypothetical protein MTOK_04750 [Mycolicibacterium tokaiense]STZ60801.1 flagellar hook-length control protein [Mycolicibacterium tokaiense]
MTPTLITTASDVVTAAMGIAKDAAEGRLGPTDLEAELQVELRNLLGVVVGPDDPAWPVQLDVARAVIAAGGIPTDELSEWVAVQRRRERPDEVDPAQTPPEPVSAPSGSHSPEADAAEAITETPAEPEVVAGLTLVPDPKPAPVAAPPVQADGGSYDPLRGWQPGGTRRR